MTCGAASLLLTLCAGAVSDRCGEGGREGGEGGEGRGGEGRGGEGRGGEGRGGEGRGGEGRGGEGRGGEGRGGEGREGGTHITTHDSRMNRTRLTFLPQHVTESISTI